MAELFPDSVEVLGGEGVAPEARVKWEDVPGRGTVYLLVAGDAEAGGEQPLLLATVGDLRAALKRRLMEVAGEAKSKRVAYAEVCTRIYWRRVDSSFAANWWYWRAAREVFPETYAALIPWRLSWWIGVENEGPYPRLRRTTDLGDEDLLYAGPVRDKQQAGKLIETVEDLFDLCRYHQVLVQAPHGKACAYKEMGKCPAPCDGSVPVAWYRGQMEKAWGFITGATRATWRDETEAAMRAAAGRLEFETAGRIKQRMERAKMLEGRSGEAFAHVGRLEDFSFVGILPGKGKPWMEPWVIHGGRVECLPQVQKKGMAVGAQEVLARYLEIAAAPVRAPLAKAEMEQVALAAHHLFRGEDDHGIYVRGEDVQQRGAETILEAAEKLWARKAAKPLVEQSSDIGGKESPVQAPDAGGKTEDPALPTGAPVQEMPE